METLQTVNVKHGQDILLSKTRKKINKCSTDNQ